MDPAARKFMWNVVKGITDHNQNTCVVLTTHIMEEAEELSTKMGIMVAGGRFTCFGNRQHIKDKFGSGYEIEVKFKNEISYELYSEIGRVGEESSLREFTDGAVNNRMISKEHAELLMKYIEQNICFVKGISADCI